MTFWKTVAAVMVGISFMLWFYIVALHIQCHFQPGCSIKWSWER
jgi:hypothetical protein